MPDTLDCPRQQAFSFFCPQQAITASHKVLTDEQPKCRIPGYKLQSSPAHPARHKQLSVAALGKPHLGDQLGAWAGSVTSFSRLYSCAATEEPELCSTICCGQQFKNISSSGLRNCEIAQPAKLTDSPWGRSRSAKGFNKDQRWCRLASLGQTLHFLIGKRNKMKSQVRLRTVTACIQTGHNQTLSNTGGGKHHRSTTRKPV